MKIIEVEYLEEFDQLFIAVDVIPTEKFAFNIDDIANKTDLKAKVKKSANDFLAKQADKAAKKALSETYKSLEGKEI